MCLSPPETVSCSETEPGPFVFALLIWHMVATQGVSSNGSKERCQSRIGMCRGLCEVIQPVRRMLQIIFRKASENMGENPGNKEISKKRGSVRKLKIP